MGKNFKQNISVHKKNKNPSAKPKISIVLLDWSCRESFHALDWLLKQNVTKQEYEIIWVELYDRVVDDAMEKADTVITCGQTGTYHKHLGYNIGLLYARGELITICDSDAVFPPDFIESIMNSFYPGGSTIPVSKVLMHYEWRTSSLYPKDMNNIEDLKKHEWADLWPNVGACMTMTVNDVIRLGGFDEHRSYKGYICGPYDLGWRAVNAGVPEEWHDESIALWHFSHPDPPATYGQKFSIKLWSEKTYPHIDHHALTAVEAFSTGRILPLAENSQIFKLRMQRRIIGTQFEEKYSNRTPQNGFSTIHRTRLFLLLYAEPIVKMLKHHIIKPTLDTVKNLIGGQNYNMIKRFIIGSADDKK
jgi:glycosyltransferase involved in cell wall biosynthesis